MALEEIAPSMLPVSDWQELRTDEQDCLKRMIVMKAVKGMTA
jgi:hypothetical protein|tara:strand:+ start:120 stop:245 length:126 start_codon:yes stop_codon:yes gene_type:complete